MIDRDARLDSIRREIDAVDDALLDLLNRRGRAVLEVGAVKSDRTEPRYYRPEREISVIRRLAAANGGPLPDREVVRLFREVMSTCRSLEQRLTVVCTSVGEACAATGHFGGAVDLCASPCTGQALDDVAGARYDYAVVGFSGAGEAPPAVATLPERGLAACAEWRAQGGERYLVVGHAAVPPTGDDWTAMVVPVHRVAAIESWCGVTNLGMRSTPVSTVASSAFVEVALHAGNPLLAPLVSEHGGVLVGTYPNTGTGRGQ